MRYALKTLVCVSIRWLKGERIAADRHAVPCARAALYVLSKFKVAPRLRLRLTEGADPGETE